jgi:ribosomal protein S18 acetylase RimI-like enzyme
MEVRRLRKDEGEVLRALRLSALRESPRAFGGSLEVEESLPPSDFSRMAEDRAMSERDAIFVATDRAEFVGLVSAFFDNNSGEPFISSMWVAPGHRRRGVGAMLVRAARRWLASSGATKVYAWVTSTNTKAIAFYESLGFEATETAGRPPSNRSVTERLYVLGLAGGG